MNINPRKNNKPILVSNLNNNNNTINNTIIKENQTFSPTIPYKNSENKPKRIFQKSSYDSKYEINKRNNINSNNIYKNYANNNLKNPENKTSINGSDNKHTSYKISILGKRKEKNDGKK